jgi:hypothetical protein
MQPQSHWFWLYGPGLTNCACSGCQLVQAVQAPSWSGVQARRYCPVAHSARVHGAQVAPLLK